jgi:hypothetical protein
MSAERVFLSGRAGKAEDGSIREGSFLRVRSWTPNHTAGEPLFGFMRQYWFANRPYANPPCVLSCVQHPG